MARLIASILVILALHGGLHPGSPLPVAEAGQGFGAYVRGIVTGAGVVPTTHIRFGETIARPPAASVTQAW